MILKQTETVVFDPSIKEHRRAVIAFRKRNAWSDSPIRFSFDPNYSSVTEHVQSKMLDWFLEQDSLNDTKGS